MILSRRIALGGQQLDELEDRIVIRSINPGVPNEKLEDTPRMGGAGTRLTSEHWNTLDVTVTFAIDVPKTELQTRREIFDLVKAWALKKGWLTISYMPGKRMYVDKVIVPGGGDMWQWTNEYTITFRAYNVPFWTDEVPTSSTFEGTNGSAEILVNGNVQTVLDVTISNTSGQNIQDVSITVSGKKMTFTGVNLSANQQLVISHGTDGLLRAKVGSTSVYSKITGADDLYAEPGNVSVTVKATRAVSAKISAYGRYV